MMRLTVSNKVYCEVLQQTGQLSLEAALADSYSKKQRKVWVTSVVLVWL